MNDQENVQKLNHQDQLRLTIRGIASNTSLSQEQKTKMIQEAMANQYATVQPCVKQMKVDPPTTAAYRNQAENLLGCVHYHRNCRLQAPCCGEWYTCRMCHDETNNHEIDRFSISTMQCMKCFTVQGCGQTCTQCQESMASYYCDICHLWSNDASVSIYHCDGCRLCRIGKGLGIDYFHCDKCKACLLMEMKEQHQCFERVLDSNCPICTEFLFTSTRSITFMRCRHPIHVECLEQWLMKESYCPVCHKSVCDLSNFYHHIDSHLLSHQMPTEYAYHRSTIFCHDCEKRSVAPFHFIYHKCFDCGSYNTRTLSTYIAPKDDPDDNALIAARLARFPPQATLNVALSANRDGDMSDEESSEDNTENTENGENNQDSHHRRMTIEEEEEIDDDDDKFVEAEEDVTAQHHRDDTGIITEELDDERNGSHDASQWSPFEDDEEDDDDEEDMEEEDELVDERDINVIAELRRDLVSDLGHLVDNTAALERMGRLIDRLNSEGTRPSFFPSAQVIQALVQDGMDLSHFSQNVDQLGLVVDHMDDSQETTQSLSDKESSS